MGIAEVVAVAGRDASLVLVGVVRFSKAWWDLAG